jgi:GTP cyclohydrolase I
MLAGKTNISAGLLIFNKKNLCMASRGEKRQTSYLITQAESLRLAHWAKQSLF